MFDGWPFGWVFLVFFAGSMVRANATYWLGRGARRGGERTRAGRRLDGPLMARAESLVRRRGAPVVAVGFLTVGVQTAVNLAAGVMRMPLPRFQIAAAVGSLAWAAIYATVGFAVVEAWVGRAGLPVAAVAVAAVAVVVVTTAALRRARG